MNLTIITITLSFIILNLLAFIVVGLDKRKSMTEGAERTPELSLFLWAIFMASLGVLVGMIAWHHKTRKWTFIFGIGLLTIQQILLIYFLTINYLK